MLSKNKIKFIKSLQQKKNRSEFNAFVVEGIKSVSSLRNSGFKIIEIYCSDSALKKSPDLQELNPVVVDELSIDKASGLKSNKDASYRILAQIASSVPKRVKFDAVEYNGIDQVIIHGVAANDKDILKLITNLGKQKMIKCSWPAFFCPV